MNSTINKMLLIAASACLMAQTVHAQDIRMSATVPFAFSANGVSLQPGTYQVRRAVSSSVEWLESVNGKAKIVVSAGYGASTDSGGPRLVFNCYGDQRFLSEVSTGDGRIVKAIRSKQEEAVREQVAFREPTQVSVYLASLR